MKKVKEVWILETSPGLRLFTSNHTRKREKKKKNTKRNKKQKFLRAEN